MGRVRGGKNFFDAFYDGYLRFGKKASIRDGHHFSIHYNALISVLFPSRKIRTDEVMKKSLT
jgi:hypothetical protein